MSADVTLRKMRSLVASLREVGDSRTADLVEATLDPTAKTPEVEIKRVWQFNETANSMLH